MAAVAIVLLDVFPLHEAYAVMHRVWPVMAFLLLLTVLADLCADAGLFEAAASYAAYVARGRPRSLFALFCALATLTTWFLSLDTTVVLLTPVAIALARRVDVPVLPYALACLWLANTASLLLPVSNLTNLLGEHTLPPDRSFVALSVAPQAAILAVTAVVLLVLHARRAPASYGVVRPPRPEDPVALAVAAIAAVGVGIAASAGIPAWIAALIAVLGLWTMLAVRRRARPPRQIVRELPLLMVIGTTSLFILISALAGILRPALTALAVSTNGLGDLLTLSGAGAAAANVANNLPVYLALEPLAQTPEALMSLLVGVNAGPLVLLWGSLANLLWWRTCRRAGVEIALWRLSALGLLVASASVLAGVTALWLVAS